jgi:hypothetical protein
MSKKRKIEEKSSATLSEEKSTVPLSRSERAGLTFPAGESAYFPFRPHKLFV